MGPFLNHFIQNPNGATAILMHWTEKKVQTKSISAHILGKVGHMTLIDPRISMISFFLKRC